MRIFQRNRKDDFDIFLPQHVYHKMLAYAKVCNGEISGWGKTKITNKKNGGKALVTILDIRIFKQVVTDAHTSLSTDTLTTFYLDLIKEREDPSSWNLWWHSHNDFNVFFSMEDEGTIKATATGRLYSICINKAGDLIARVDEKRKCIAENIEVRIENPVLDTLIASCRVEVKKKVKYDQPTIKRFSKKDSPIIFSDKPFTPTHDNYPDIFNSDDDRSPTSKNIMWYEYDKKTRAR